MAESQGFKGLFSFAKKNSISHFIGFLRIRDHDRMQPSIQILIIEAGSVYFSFAFHSYIFYHTKLRSDVLFGRFS